MLRKAALAVASFLVALTLGWWFLHQSPAKVAPQAPVQVASAPPYSPPKTRDPQLGTLVNRNIPVEMRVTPDMPTRFPKILYAEDCAALASVLTDSADSDVARNEVANLLRRSSYPELGDKLLQVANSSNESPRFRAFATQQLSELLGKGQGERQLTIVSALQERLNDKDVEVRREALLALVKQRDPRGCATAVKWLNDASSAYDDVRDLTIACVHDLNLREQIPVVRKFLIHPAEPIRIAAIVALSQWRDEESRTAFQDAASSKVARIQRAGKAALERLDRPKEKALSPR